MSFAMLLPAEPTSATTAPARVPAQNLHSRMADPDRRAVVIALPPLVTLISWRIASTARSFPRPLLTIETVPRCPEGNVGGRVVRRKGPIDQQLAGPFERAVAR